MLPSLTVRGRSFLFAGAAMAVGAMLFDYHVLLRIAVLLIVAPLVSLMMVRRTQYRISCRRALEPAYVTAGKEAHVYLRLDNVSRLPSGTLLVEDRVPYTLGSHPRFVLQRVEPSGKREVVYRVRSDTRGRYTLGPLTLRLTDPFGMCELSRSFSAQHTLTVTPPVISLPDIRLGHAWTGRGEGHAATAAAAGADDVGTREYRYGDDMRRVHWRSTARLGELMVRREEQVWQSSATLLLDSRGIAHRGDGPSSSFEWAVSAAASIGVHLTRHGYALRLLTADGCVVTTAEQGVGQVDADGMLLGTLAGMATSRQPTLLTAYQEMRATAGGGLLVAIVGDLDAEQAAELARRRTPTAAGIAFVIDTAAWVGLGAPNASPSRDMEERRLAANLDLLRATGWRVRRVRPGARLADLWRDSAMNDAIADSGSVHQHAEDMT